MQACLAGFSPPSNTNNVGLNLSSFLPCNQPKSYSHCTPSNSIESDAIFRMAVDSTSGLLAQAHHDDSLFRLGKPHVFVFGGLTFLGRNLIPALVKAGYGVKSMAATVEQRTRLRVLGCGSVGYGEPYSLEAVKLAAKGCLYAVHCACKFVHCDISEDNTVALSNHLITTNIVKACRELQILKLVFRSSEAALFEGNPLSCVDETCPYPINPVGSCAESLQTAEARVLSANSELLETIVVRPRLLWGGDDDQFVPCLVKNAKAGTLRLVGEGRFLTSTCHIANACEGVICALRNGQGGDVYFLTDGSPIIFREFVRGLLLASGVREVEEAISRSIPLWLARRLAKLAEVMGKRMGKQPQLTQSGVGLIGQEITVLDRRAREKLGYEGAKSVAQGMMDMRLANLQRKAKEDLGRLE